MDKRADFFKGKLQLFSLDKTKSALDSKRTFVWYVIRLEDYRKTSFASSWESLFLASQLGWKPSSDHCLKCNTDGTVPCLECQKQPQQYRQDANSYLSQDRLWPDPGTLFPEEPTKSFWQRLRDLFRADHF